jgi:hypothetical protein
MPRGCAEEYCLEFAGMASREMLWCVDRVPPAGSQARAIEIAYRRYRDEYPSAPELEALVVFAHESASSVLFEFDDRKYWDCCEGRQGRTYAGRSADVRTLKERVGVASCSNNQRASGYSKSRRPTTSPPSNNRVNAPVRSGHAACTKRKRRARPPRALRSAFGGLNHDGRETPETPYSRNSNRDLWAASLQSSFLSPSGVHLRWSDSSRGRTRFS